MMLQSTPSVSAQQTRLHTARRMFSFLPVLVFLLTLMLLAAPTGHSYPYFLQVVLQSVAVSLASCFVSIAAYGIYRYLSDHSVGL